jgi:shikimate kinase
MSDRLILIFGPSGIGKTTAIKAARCQLTEMEFACLDKLTENLARERLMIGGSENIVNLRNQFLQQPDKFLELGKTAIDAELERSCKGHVVIDVGAGFLDAPGADAWLTCNNTVLFWAPVEIAYRRAQSKGNEGRCQSQYALQEYSSRRLKLYEQATVRINAECQAPELFCRLIDILIGLAQQ